MTATNNIILNRIFTQNTFKNLLESKFDLSYCTVIKRYINDPDAKSNLELLSEIYRVMDKRYRNEYFYKNTILNKLLLGRHSLNTTIALTEIPVAKSKADFILINGKATVYEIKTALDTFERLDNQLVDYYKAFSQVCVVTCEENYDAVLKKLKNTPVGICLLTKKNTISTKKEPIEDISKLDLSMMFKILRKNEYEFIIDEYCGELPRVSQFKYYNACKALFCDLDKNIAYKFFIKALKKRQKIDITEYSTVPYELKYLIYFSKFKKKDYLQLNSFLKTTFGG